MDFVQFSEFKGCLCTHYHVNEFKQPQLRTIKERSKARPERPLLHQHSWYPGPPSHRVARVWEEELWDREGLWETFEKTSPHRRYEIGGKSEANLSLWQWCHTCGEVDNVDNIEEGGLNKVKKVETNHEEINSEGEEWMASLRLKVEGEEDEEKTVGEEDEEKTVGRRRSLWSFTSS